MKTDLSKIRSIAIGKANRLQRAHRNLDQLAPAFAEWAEGEIYICKKTGTYRYRFGDRSKSVATWDAIAREIFATPQEFAFAAMVLAPAAPIERPTPAVVPKPVATNRPNIIALASAA